MNRTRLHWALIAGSAAAVGVGVALGMRAVTELVDATLPDARGIASFNRPGTVTLLSANGKVPLYALLGICLAFSVNFSSLDLLARSQ